MRAEQAERLRIERGRAIVHQITMLCAKPVDLRQRQAYRQTERSS